MEKEKKTWVQIIEELEQENAKLLNENIKLKSKLEKSKLEKSNIDLKTYHTDTAYYEKRKEYEKDMFKYCFSWKLFLFFVFSGIFVLMGLIVCSHC